MDAAIDVGATLGAPLNRIRFLERVAPPDVAEGIRGIRDVLELTLWDWESRFRAFEQEFERVRPPGGSSVRPDSGPP